MPSVVHFEIHDSEPGRVLPALDDGLGRIGPLRGTRELPKLAGPAIPTAV